MRPWLGALAVFTLGVLLRLPSFSRPVLSADEARHVANAAALARGERLYREVAALEAPAVPYIYQAGAWLLGPGHAQGAHLLALLAALATATLLWRLVVADTSLVAGRASQGAAAAGLFLVFSTTWWAPDVLAAGGGLFLLLPQTAAALLLLRAVDAPPGRHPLPGHLVIGALIGLSALCRYRGLSFLLVSAGLLAWAARTGRMSARRAILALLLQGLGALLPPAMYIAWAAGHDAQASQVAWRLLRGSLPAAGAAGPRGLGGLLLMAVVALVPVALGFAAAASAVKRAVRAWGNPPAAPAASPPLDPRAWLGTLWLAAAGLAVVLMIAAGGRLRGQDFQLLLPPLCLLAAAPFQRLWWRGRAWRALLAGLCGGPALFFFLRAGWFR